MKLFSLTAIGIAAALASTSALAAPVDASTLQYNGSASNAAPGVIRLTNGANLADPMDPLSNIGEAGSAFIGTAFDSTSGFVTSFTFSLTNAGFDPLADGVTFMFQNDGAGAMALGGGGGGVGADGLTNSVGVAFQSWDNNHATIFTGGNVFGGTQPLGNFNLGDQDDVVRVTLSYLAATLSYSATNLSTGQMITDSRAFNLTSLGPSVYLGFTGATGLSYSVQDVTDWDLEVIAGAGGVPEPATWAMMIAGFGGMGVMLRRRRAALA